ncbi:MAG: 2-hydroxyacyl-CoA dehydratase family protein [Proteobacteria bacterium]|nr:2-hydroxyacyl-CoA dehydratase family protein [Pseudomonadota bacterium]
MRPETKAYHFDWMLWRSFDGAEKMMSGTPKEIERALEYMPHFRRGMEAFLRHGSAGRHLLTMMRAYFENILTARDRGKKLVATTFCFSPAILYAMDVVPVCLEVLTTAASMTWKRGAADYLDYCVEVGFTETSCSAQRGALGAILAGLAEEIDFIVCDSGGVCDTNANAFAFASAYLDKPFYQLNYPPTLTDERARTYHRQDYRALIEFIESQTGRPLDPDRLRRTIEEIGRQDELLAEIEELQRLAPNPVPGIYNMFIYSGRFMFDGQPVYTRALECMLDHVSENARLGRSGLHSGEERARAFFCYIDHYTTDMRLWDWLDDRGVSHLGGILSRFYSDAAPFVRGIEESAYRLDTTGLDEMIDAMAALNSRMPMVRSIRGPYDAPYMWLDDTLGLARMYRADCIVYNGTPGCRNTWGMVRPFARDTEKHGFPTHIMNADAFDDRVESWESASDRLEEFFNVRRLLA